MKKKLLYLFIISYSLSLTAFSDNKTKIQKFFNVDFHISMSHLERYDIHRAKTDPDWIQAKYLYDTFIMQNLEYLTQPRIPKIIHQIWLGSEFPEKYKALQQSWIVSHPNWEYKLWRDQDIEDLALNNIELYKSAGNYGEKSDIARYEILYRFGGLYVDTDFECLRPLDVLHHCCDFYTGCVSCPHIVTFNGLIAAVPGHPILKRCIDDLEKNSKIKKSTLEKSGPGYFTRCVLKELFNDSVGRCVIFPATYFYPWPWYKRNLNSPTFVKTLIKPESFAIHHWNASWLKNQKP